MNESTPKHSRLEKLLLQASRTLNSTVEYEELIRLALQLVCHAMKCEAAFIFRLDEKIHHRRVRLLISGQDKLLVLQKELGVGITGWAVDTGSPVILNNPSESRHYTGEIAKQLDFPIRNLIVIPLVARGKIFGALEAINKCEGEFSDLDRDTLLGLSDQIAISIENGQLLRAARRRAREQELLLESARKLSGALKLEDALEMILDAVGELVGFDAGGIFLIDRDKGEFGQIYHKGYEPEYENKLHLKTDAGLIGWVAQKNVCVTVPDVTKDPRYVSARSATRSEMVCPLSIGDQVVGVFNVESDEVGAYDGHKSDLLEAFGAQAALVIERTRLHKEIVAARELEKQLEIAHEIQREFLPDHDPVVPGYDIAGMNLASGEVGGDYYGYHKVDERQIGLAIADVAGKGIPAALLMASFRASLVAEIRNTFSVSEICVRVNKLIHESVEPGVYVTAFYLSLNFETHTFNYTNAGHNPPMLLRSSGAVELLEDGGPPFGIVADALFPESSVALGSGDIVLAYTDGVTEAENERSEQFGEERLVATLKRCSGAGAGELISEVRNAVSDFVGKARQSDDLTILVVKRR